VSQSCERLVPGSVSVLRGSISAHLFCDLVILCVLAL